MKPRELRAKNDEELKELIDDSIEELFNLRFQKVRNQMNNTARPRQVRRTIARIKTILRERELAS